jgi:transposase
VAVCCKLHSAQRGLATAAVLSDLNAERRWLTYHIKKLRRLALQLIKADPQFARWYELMLSMPGIGPATATTLIGEYGVLPAGLSKEQWVALAGLDPQPRESGKSVNKPRHISKKGGARVRGGLFLPANSAIRSCAQIRHYYEKILTRTSRKLPALCAVMRKMLQALWGMLHYDQQFNPARFCPNG